MTFGITWVFDTPFFEGGSTSSLVPAQYDVALAGIPFLIDHAMVTNRLGQNQWQSDTIDLLKPQQDGSATPGEHSLTPDGLWRRAMESWHLGAGQSYLDRPDSDGARFRSSKGLDPSTRWELSLLPDTVAMDTVSTVNNCMVPAGDRLYWSDDTVLRYRTTFPGSPTTVTSAAPSTIRSLTSDGFHVFSAHGSGITVTDTSSSAATAFSAVIADVIGYHKGYLVAGVGNLIKSINSSGTPTTLFTHLNADFSFVDFADGPSAIYAAGYSGDKSIIYQIGFKADGTGLDVALPAGELPDGEIVRAIQGYLGFVVVGTDKGVRFCTTDANTGALSVGALIPASPVRCFEGQDRYMWFGWSNYDAVSTGLGRLDLKSINPGQAPAYWSDLMATAQGDVVAVCTWQGRQVFMVAGEGMWETGTNKVASGTLDSGNITYTLPDEKTAVAVDIRHRTLLADGGSYTEAISIDGADFTQIGSHDAVMNFDVHGTTFSAGQRAGETIELRHVLTRGTTITEGPTITRVTLKALPRANTQQTFIVPVVINEELNTRGGKVLVKPTFILRAVRAIRALQQVVPYQEFDESYAVVIDGLTFYRDGHNVQGDQPRGTLVMHLKTLDASA